MLPLAAMAGAAAALLAALGAVGYWRRGPTPGGAIEIAPGVHMPLVANGISRNHSVWLASGGRHIDTAFLYGDAQQALVGEAIAASGLPREELFVTTKVTCCPTDRCTSTGYPFCEEPPNPVGVGTHTGAERLDLMRNATEQLQHSLRLLRLARADLVLLHFPCSRFEDTLAAYRELEAAHAAGIARAIGVSNLNASTLAALLAEAAVRPAVNQVAFSVGGHPAAHDGAGTACEEGSRLYGADDETLRYSQAQGVALAAYSPLGSISKVDVLGNAVVTEVAATRGVSAAQVGLRWLVQQRIAAVTATTNPDHAAEALGVLGFQLSGSEMRRLAEE